MTVSCSKHDATKRPCSAQQVVIYYLSHTRMSGVCGPNSYMHLLHHIIVRILLIYACLVGQLLRYAFLLGVVTPRAHLAMLGAIPETSVWWL